MPKNVTDKLCQRLLKSAPKQAADPCGIIWGEAAIPECMKKAAKTNKHHKEKTC